MGEQFHDPESSGRMTEHLNTPRVIGPLPVQDTSSILQESNQYFQLDLDQAPKAIATFRQVAEELRDLKRVANNLANIRPPGFDAVSVNAAKEIGHWAASPAPDSLRSTLESGAMELERVADALERSVATHRDIDEASAAHLRRSEL